MPQADTRIIKINQLDSNGARNPLNVSMPDFNRKHMDDVSFMTAMTLVLLGNYAQTGHFGGPLAYTPYNVAAHLAGPELGGLSYDIRQPKHPYSDNFMLAGGHNIPSGYALWMVLNEAMRKQHNRTGDDQYKVSFDQGIFAIDALGFRRGANALETLLEDNDLSGHPSFADAKIRGIKALAGHSESTDMTNDVNGGPSGIGLSTAAGKAMFWDAISAPENKKVMALEGEFAMTEGHAQELKSIALAQKVGKRLRVLLSYNNAGIDDKLLGGVIDDKYVGYDIPNQWASYGWKVLELEDGNDIDQIVAAFKTMEDAPSNDKRPFIVVGNTTKGWWPVTSNGRVGSHEQLVSFASHPYTMKMNSDYFIALAESYENHFGVTFSGIRDGTPESEHARLIEFKTNIDIALSVMDQDSNLGEWIANRLVNIADTVESNIETRLSAVANPFLDERLAPGNLPIDPQSVTTAGADQTISLFRKPGEKAGTRRAISEVGKWLNFVTDNRFYTLAADLSDSINVDKAHFAGIYDPESNPGGTRLKGAIQEAGNAATIAGLASQTMSKDPTVHSGVWGLSGTYGAFTPLMYTPIRVFSQQNQDSPFAMGVVTILAGHSGPETAADARTHFGIFAPHVWTLFPRGQVLNLYFWDYNDVAPGYFSAVHHAARTKEAGLIVIHVARPDFNVADRSKFADTDIRAAGKGAYIIRDYSPDQPPMGTVYVQGSSSTNNLVSTIPQLESEKINVRIVAVISEDLLRLQPASYQQQILSDSDRFDCMFITTMTKRVPPLSNLGPLAEEFSLSSDFDDRWRSGGSEEDVIRDSRLDPKSIFDGIKHFANSRVDRLSRQRNAIGNL